VGRGTEITVPDTVAFTGTTNGSIDEEAEADTLSAEEVDAAVGFVEVGVGVDEDSAGGVYVDVGGVQVEVGVQVDVGGGVQAGLVEVLGFWVVGAGAGAGACPPPPPPLKDQDIWKTPAPGSYLSAYAIDMMERSEKRGDIRRSS
jgi:hypothetical protein